MKSYTDLGQGINLEEILPIESADMIYPYDRNLNEMYGYFPYVIGYKKFNKDTDIPCWSLTALLSVLPKIGAEEPMIRKLYYASEPKERYICQYGLTNITSEYDNPIDACVEMVLKLKENELI